MFTSCLSEVSKDAATDFISSCKDDNESENFADLEPAPKDLDKPSFLKPVYFVLNNGLVFHDKLLPNPEGPLYQADKIKFSKEYYVDLHFRISSHNNFNHLGARKPLDHSHINIKKFRDLLPQDYNDCVILQYLEYGFPLGLNHDFTLCPVLKNHSSSYEYFPHVDKFVKNEL